MLTNKIQKNLSFLRIIKFNAAIHLNLIKEFNIIMSVILP